MKVLVTGLQGFTGRYLKLELERYDHIVVGLSSNLTKFSDLSLEIRRVQPEAVVHLAGIAFVGHGNPRDFYNVNLIGTHNLLTAISEQTPKIQSILLASSANIYGSNSEGTIDENTLPAPTNDYAVSKLSMELMSNLWADRLPISIVRPFNYTGVGQNVDFLIPKIISHFKMRKNVIELGNIDVWREFGDVRSVASIYRKLLEIKPVGKTLNVCTGQAYSLNEILTLCKSLTGHDIEIEVNPKFVRENEVRVLTGDNSLLKRTIGKWKIYTLEETLRWMLNA